MELENHFFVPREDFYALQQAAAEPPTNAERAANTAQGLIILAGMGAVAVASCAGFIAAADWLEEKREARKEKRRTRLTSVKS